MKIKKKKEKNICVGTGLIALDIVMNGDPKVKKYYVGGSCGNVLTILSYIGWESYPIARLAKNKYTKIITRDLSSWNVRTDFLKETNTGSTPIIIHRIKKNKKGEPYHRFEFKWPNTNEWLPSYKPVLANSINDACYDEINPKVFYFDKINRAAIELGKIYRKKGALIVFEPSSIKDIKLFNECLEISHIIKYSHDRLNNYKILFPNPKVPLEIETLGKNGLMFRTKYYKKWKIVPPFIVNNFADAAGSGDWCTAMIINLFSESYFKITEKGFYKEIEEKLLLSQILSAYNCKYEGARGLMYNVEKNKIINFIENYCFNNKDIIREDKINSIFTEHFFS